MNNELGFYDEKAALTVAEKLIKESYVVMLSKEESLTILSFEWSLKSDRNDIIFKRKDEECEECENFEDLNKSIDDISKEIRHFFLDEYDIKLEDSPQIAPECLYLEFDTMELGERKLRISFDERMSYEDFLTTTKDDRMNWICRKVIAYII